jgi:hypothetical protein
MRSFYPYARGVQGGLLVRRDEHKGEAGWCVNNLVLRHLLPQRYHEHLLSVAADDLIFLNQLVDQSFLRLWVWYIVCQTFTILLVDAMRMSS